MKSLPVYELGQWIKTEKNIGRIVARAESANIFECLAEFGDNPHVQSMSNRGAGYCIEWVELQYEDWPTAKIMEKHKRRPSMRFRIDGLGSALTPLPRSVTSLARTR